MRRSLLPFLGDALSWLTRTATTKDNSSIKTRINQLMATQPTGDPSPHHLYSQHHQICHPGEHATHQHGDEPSRKDTPGYHSTLQYHTLPVQQPELSANCTPHLLYPGKPPGFPVLCERSHHTHLGLCWCNHNQNTLTTCTVLEDLREMLLHIKETLPSTMHLTISSEDVLHSYRYLCTHVLIADEQFLLLINVAIQHHEQQLEIYDVFNLAIPHENISACYSINNRYLGITHDETKAVEISEDQFETGQKDNEQFCSLNTPFYHLPTHQLVYQLYTPRTKPA